MRLSCTMCFSRAFHTASLFLSRLLAHPLYIFLPSLSAAFTDQPEEVPAAILRLFDEKSLLLFQLLKRLTLRRRVASLSSLLCLSRSLRYFPTLLKLTPVVGTLSDQPPAVLLPLYPADVGNRDRRNGETPDSDDVWQARRHDESVHASARN